MHSFSLIAGLVFAGAANAHVCAWTKGMYCLGGNDTANPNNPNANAPVNPLFMLEKEDWWFQHSPTGCDQFPPADGDVLELPAGGSVTVELAHNRGQTTLGPGPVSDWPDGGDGTSMTTFDSNGCVEDGAMHTTGEAGAYGSAFAISYESDLSAVTIENLVVFTVLEHTPWKRLATYDVPADLPACPEGGCHCAWLWVPNGCGEPNMYMAGYKCQVTNVTSTKTVAAAQPPVYCADDSTKCVPGAKQMIAWNQASGNNVPSSVQPGYNTVMGWQTGAQNDIFE